MESEMQQFYKNKTIFLTGASGFLGRVFIEKALRSTEVNRIYVLLRPKRGKDIQERIAAWKTDPLFELLLKSKPNALERIVSVAGDCSEPNLGISQADRKLLMNEVQLVVHSAATVNFTEPIHVALDINTRATRIMLELAKQMPRLEAFVHVSTAFSNCVIHHITERFYPEHLSCDVHKVLELREMLPTELLDSMGTALMDKFPNTYTYTKALAEQVVQTEAGELPVCIFRPGSIIATNKEPVCGWIDNLYGPIALIYGSAFGVLHIAPVNRKAHPVIVPVDSCVNTVLTCAWRTAAEAAQRKPLAIPAPPPTIYNYVPSNENLITNTEYMGFVEKKRHVYPLNQAIWYPFVHTTTNWWLFKLACIFYHLLPGHIVDLGLRVRGQKPRMVKIYNKIHKNLDVLFNFLTNGWTFDSSNTDRLWASMSATDQQLFHFDMKSLDWDSYFDHALLGMRMYLGKEDPSEDSILRARQRMNRFLILHRLLQFSLCCAAAAILRWLLLVFL